MKSNRREPKSMRMGLGLDNKDGHKRLTQGDNFVMVGGSEETHERMTETAIRFNEKLAKRGKALEELSPEEFRDIMQDAADH